MTITSEPKSIPKPTPKPSGVAKKLTPQYRKGEIWMVTESAENPPVGTEIWSNRPAMILSADVINNNSGFVQVVYLTTSTTKRASPVHIEIPSPDNKGRALVLCEQVHTVDLSRMKRRMGSVPGSYIKEVDDAVALSLSLGRRPNTYAVFTKWEHYIKTFGIDMQQQIEALAYRTTDERVEALSRALETVSAERDAYRTLYETAQTRPEALREVEESMAQSAKTQ